MNMLAHDFGEAAMPPVREVVRIVADVLRVPQAAIYGRSRGAEEVLSRHLTMYVAVQVCRHSRAHAGRVLGFDHTTVISAVKRITRLLQEDANLKATLAVIVQRFRGSQAWPDGEAAIRSSVQEAVREELPSPVEDPPVVIKLSSEALAEMQRLYAGGHGWSVRGLARRYDMKMRDVAQIVGAEWWAGPRHEPDEVRA